MFKKTKKLTVYIFTSKLNNCLTIYLLWGRTKPPSVRERGRHEREERADDERVLSVAFESIEFGGDLGGLPLGEHLFPRTPLEASLPLEPQLGLDSPVILFDWPSSQAALARLRNETDGQEEYQVAERYELYIDGLEIANGYHELCDPQEQRRRLEANHRIRLENGRPPLPLESRLLDEMESVGLPACSGVALGIERLLMVLTRSDCLADGMAFDLEQA